MKPICAGFLASLLILSGGHSLAQVELAKKADVPKENSIKPQPTPVVCPKDEAARRSETKKVPPAKNAMPAKGGLNECLDNVPVPDRPMA